MPTEKQALIRYTMGGGGLTIRGRGVKTGKTFKLDAVQIEGDPETMLQIATDLVEAVEKADALLAQDAPTDQSYVRAKVNGETVREEVKPRGELNPCLSFDRLIDMLGGPDVVKSIGLAGGVRGQADFGR